MSNPNPRYQCPRCSQSYIVDKGLFCLKFSAELASMSEEEREKVKFIYYHFGHELTRECRIVYQGWGWNCAGFREKEEQ